MSGSQQEHILMLPFMAQGHLIPFLQLARQIHHASGFTITIASTPLNVAYLSSVIAKDPVLASAQSRHQICLAAFPFNCSDFGLPPSTDNMEALPLTQVLHLLHASTTLEVPCRQLVSEITAKEGKPPFCIISDMFHGWANCVAESFRTVNVAFCTCGAYGIAAYISVWQNLPHRSVDDDEFRIPGFPDSYRFHRCQVDRVMQEANGHYPWSRFNRSQLSLSLGSFGWLCNSAEEIEPLGLGVLRQYTKLPVWAVGPLLPPGLLTNPKTLRPHSGREATISPQKCLEWLDLHPQGSVLYISFGSQNTISPTQMTELAKGLEDSGRPFIWVIRPPIGFDINGELRAEWLPEGFEERIVERKQGLLVRGWAPQLEILCHKSTAAFLSHCGWNSAMESLSQGVPIIAWPLAAEQAFYSKMMTEEMGVCIELSRGVQSTIAKEEVKRTIELVMDKKKVKGEEMKRKAAKIGELIKAALTEEGGDPKGSSLQATDDFIATLVSR